MFTNINRSEFIFWCSISVLCALKVTIGDASFFADTIPIGETNLGLYNWQKWAYHFFSTFLLFALVPILLVKLAFKGSLKDIGICLGDWRFGIGATLGAFVVLIFPVYMSSQNPEHLEFYPLTTLATTSPYLFVLWSLTYLPHYIGWELFFRGFVGFEAQKRYGLIAGIGLPTLLTTLMHIGKPTGELWGAMLGGIYMSFLTFRTRSILWVILFHWYLGLLNSYFCG